MMNVAPTRPREEDELLTLGCYDTLERTGGWERVIGWAQASQVRQIATFVARALVRFDRPADWPKGMWDNQLWDAVVAEVGRRAVATVDAAAVRERHRQAKRDRGVWLFDDPDGMATLLARLPAPEAVGAFAVLDEYGRRAGGPHDDRTLDARRADALVDLILDGAETPPGCDCEDGGATSHPPTPVSEACDQAETTEPAGAEPPRSAGTTRTSMHGAADNGQLARVDRAHPRTPTTAWTST